jgi:hypothetical protein
MQHICRLDKTLLLDMVGDVACNMTSGPVCNDQVHNHGTACMGRLSRGLDQLHPSQNSHQHNWIRQVHNMGMAVHVWTIRNEVCSHMLEGRHVKHALFHFCTFLLLLMAHRFQGSLLVLSVVS